MSTKAIFSVKSFVAILLLLGTFAAKADHGFPKIGQTVIGPNCFNYALYSSGLAKELRLSRSEELVLSLSAYNCSSVSYENLSVGDIGILPTHNTINSPLGFFMGWMPLHAFVICDEDKVCEKMGIFKDTPYQKTTFESTMRAQFAIAHLKVPTPKCIGTVGVSPSESTSTMVKFYRCAQSGNKSIYSWEVETDSLEKMLSERVFSSNHLLQTSDVMARFDRTFRSLETFLRTREGLIESVQNS